MEFEKRTIQLPHCETETVSAGTGTPATIVSSGGYDGGYEWPVNSGLGEKLTEVGQVIGWNRRFHEKAKGPVCVQTFETNAIDMMYVMDAYDLASAHLVGSSFGASTSLMAAFWYPKRVKKLVLYKPAAILGEAALQERVERLQGWRNLLLEQGVKAALESEGFCYCFPAERDDLHGGTVSDMPAEEFATALEESFRRFGTHQCTVLGLPPSMLRLLENETLIIPGKDPIHPPEAAAKLAELMPNSITAKNSYDGNGMTAACKQEVVDFLLS